MPYSVRVQRGNTYEVMRRVFLRVPAIVAVSMSDIEFRQAFLGTHGAGSHDRAGASYAGALCLPGKLVTCLPCQCQRLASPTVGQYWPLIFGKLAQKRGSLRILQQHTTIHCQEDFRIAQAWVSGSQCCWPVLKLIFGAGCKTS